MKKKLTITSAAIITLMGLPQVALADQASNFTPVEDLEPEQRQEVFQKLSEMTNGAELDWDHLAVGINEAGSIVMVEKSEVGFMGMSKPSTWSVVNRQVGSQGE